MAILSEMVSAVAEVTGRPEKTVTLMARYLREAGLISQGGRGRYAAKMEPRDATNILIAAMSIDRLDKAPEQVGLYREATLNVHDFKFTELPPQEALQWLGKEHFFGEALDELFTEHIQEGGLINCKTDLPFTNCSLELMRGSYSAELWLDDGDKSWTLNYHRNDPVFDGQPQNKRNGIARQLYKSKPDMAAKYTVTTRTFMAISDCIAGKEEEND